jgi:hypothetical protein
VRKRTIGPLPLQGGIQLRAPEGRPDGLLRALNMEMRDGYCATRRGSSHVAAIENDGATVAGTAVPANWTGQSQTTVRLGVANGELAEQRVDAIGVLMITIAAGGSEFVDGGVTVEFSTGPDTWAPLEILSHYSDVTGNFFEAISGNGVALIYFVIPKGWGLDGTGSFYSIRFTRNDSGTWTGGGAVTAVFLGPDALASWKESRAVVVAPETRAGRGPYIVAPIGSGLRWNVYDLASPTPTPRYLRDSGNNAFAYSGTAPLFDGADPLVQYVPESDALFCYLGSAYYKFADLADLSTGRGEFSPDDGADTAYEDLPLLAALPSHPAAMVLFAGRIIVGGFRLNPQGLAWSAPNEFWEIWPATNQTRLAGSGRIVAMVPVNETLYIFTTVGIWRAQFTEPLEGEESTLFVDLVEETPCVAGRSAVAAGRSVVFLSEDGVRVFNGERSRLLSSGVRDLFRSDSADPFACMRKTRAIAVWNPVENQYVLSYPLSSSPHNDTALVIDLDDETAWLWGADVSTDEVTSPPTAAQRARGVRAIGMAWDRRAQSVLAIDPEGVVFHLSSGADDLGSKTPWYLESHNVRIAASEQAVCEKVTVSVARDHFQSFSVGVIPDGDRARIDTKVVGAASDRLDTTAAFGSASLAGDITPLQLDESVVPVTWRGRKKARNHRVRVSSISPTHHPIRVVAVTAELAAEERGR